MTTEPNRVPPLDAPAPAARGGKRSDAHLAAGAAPPPLPDPEVLAKPTRRKFSAEYRMQILEEADRCAGNGDIGRMLRREGLHTSHLSVWRKARREGALRALAPKKRGAKPAPVNPLAAEVRRLKTKVARLERDLDTARTVIDVQGNVAGLLGLRFEDGKSA